MPTPKPHLRVRAVLDSRLGATSKIILIAIAASLGDGDDCMLSAEAIAAMTGTGERTVRNHVGRLLAVGVLVRDFDGPGVAGWYRIVWDALARAGPHRRGGRGGARAPRRLAAGAWN